MWLCAVTLAAQDLCVVVTVSVHVSAVRKFHTSIFRNRGHCATSRKVAGSIPGGVGIFHWHNSSGSIMVLGVDSA